MSRAFWIYEFIWSCKFFLSFNAFIRFWSVFPRPFEACILGIKKKRTDRARDNLLKSETTTSSRFDKTSERSAFNPASCVFFPRQINYNRRSLQSVSIARDWRARVHFDLFHTRDTYDQLFRWITSNEASRRIIYRRITTGRLKMHRGTWYKYPATVSLTSIYRFLMRRRVIGKSVFFFSPQRNDREQSLNDTFNE